MDENNVELTLAEDWEDYWVLADGWYYYKNILGEDDETSLLLDEVHLKGEETDNKYQGLTLKIKVEAQAVQASNDAIFDAWELEDLPDGVVEWTSGAAE